MRPLPALVIGFLLCASAMAQVAPTTGPTTHPATQSSAFDPARHMRVDEVREGMKGYGLSVLSGTTISRFDVEVITVLKNVFGPNRSVIMIRCVDAFMEHVGPIAGCSGSPIYLYDESGTARLVGAYAYGFDLARDPIIGVQPIEYMLTLEKPGAGPVATAGRTASWSLLESETFTALAGPHSPRSRARPDSPASLQSRTAGGPRLRQLLTPLSVRGMSQSQIERVAPMLRSSGFEPLLAPGGGADVAADVKIEPGSVLGAAMLSGDLELAAIGTCTEVIDGRAYGFGHPFNGEGATSIPMSAGSINLVMPVLTSSFKMGAIGKPAGAIDMDGTSGVAGQIGAKARTFPITIETDDRSNGLKQTFEYQCAVHPVMTPMIVGMALQASLDSEKSLPKEHTVDYELELEFEGGRSLKMAGLATSVTGDSIPQNAVWPAMLLASNPLQEINLQGVRARAVIREGASAAEILSATPAAATYKPGETVVVYLRLKPYRGNVFEKTIEIALPEQIDDGDYSIAIADAATNLQFDMQTRPGRFAVRTIQELFETLETVVDQTRTDRIYARLTGARQHVSIGRTSLEKLPPSRRMILEAAARPDLSAGVETTVKVIEMDQAISGSADLVIHVSRKLP